MPAPPKVRFCRKFECGPTRPIPAETFLCEESFTKSTPKTSWFLEFQRRGSYLTPFEPPCIGSQYIRRRHSAARSATDTKPNNHLVMGKSGGESFAKQGSRGDVPLQRRIQRGHFLFGAPFVHFLAIGNGPRCGARSSTKGFAESSEKEQRSFSCPRQQKDNFAVCVSAGLGCVSPQGGLPGGFCGKDDGPLYPRFTRRGLFFFCLKSVVSAS